MSQGVADIQAEIIRRLAPLAATRTVIEDESAAHRGHVGAAGGGGHYRLTLVATAFSGKNTVARHRLIYDLLGDLLRGPQAKIHALAIKALTPGEDSV